VVEKMADAWDKPQISGDRGVWKNFIHKENCAEKGMVNKF